VKIRVIEEKCTGHARCYGLAPGLFSVDDYGLSSVVGDGTVPAYYSGSPDWAKTVNLIRLTPNGDVAVTREPVVL